MPKLHELLAVVMDQKGQSEKVRSGLKETFEKKRHLFEGKRVTFNPLKEGESPRVDEQREVQTTVRKELDWVSDHLIRAIDVSTQVALANSESKADIVVGGKTIVSGIPGTMLLELEKRMAEFKELAESIPTLDPAKGFKWDLDSLTYRADGFVRPRTEKVQEAIVLYPATKEHPAQTQLISVDRKIGELSTIEWSGSITPADKAQMIANIEVLSRAIKKARMRANDIEVKNKAKIGRELFDFAFSTTNLGQAEAQD